MSRARKAGVSITPRNIFQHQTVEALAGVAGVVQQTSAAVADMEAGGLLPVPIMLHLQERGGPFQGFSQQMLLQTPPGLQKNELIAALQALLNQHAALRLKLRREPGEARRYEIAEAGIVRAADCIQRIQVAGLSAADRWACIKSHGEEARRRLDPEAGVMVQTVWFDAGAEEAGRLWLVIHHLSVDGVSWRILLPDLKAAWEAVAAGKQPLLERTGTSYRRWAEQLHAHAAERATRELALWEGMLRGGIQLLPDAKLDTQRDTVSSAGYLQLTLPAEVTEALLTTVPASFHGQINDVLLTAMALALSRWSGTSGPVVIEMEGHGREEIFAGIDLSRTVGWFTTIFPVLLDLEGIDLSEAWNGGRSLGQALKSIKEQLRVIPDGGIGYGMLRYLTSRTETKTKQWEAPQIGFNYLGRFSTPRAVDWEIAPEVDGLAGGSEAEMPLAHCLELNAITLDRPEGPELIANWSWASSLLSEPQVRELAKTWFDALALLANHAGHKHLKGLTPSDLPLVSLSQHDINLLEATVFEREIKELSVSPHI